MTNPPPPEAIEALRNYLRNPWYKCDDRARGPIPEWCIALMHEAADMLTALTPDPDRLLALTAAAEPVCYLPTKTVEWLDTYDGPACAKMTAVHNRPIKTDGGVPVYRIPANALAALSRIEAQAEARGMRKAVAEIMPMLSSALASKEAAHTEGFANAMGERADGIELSIRRISALADATEAAAKGGV